MNIFNRLFAALALFGALTVPAFAEALTDTQQQALTERVESFDTAMRENDMQTVMGVVPPKVLEKIAAGAGMSVDDLLAAMQAQMDEVMGKVEIVSFGMELDGVEYTTFDSGVVYGMIPTETVIDLGKEAGGKMRAKSDTLGLLDGDTWYLVRIDDPQQVAIIKEVYPEFADVAFPAGTVEPVTE
jgi:hypothetical protein